MNIRAIIKKRWLYVASAILIWLSVYIAFYLGLFTPLENRLFDYAFEHRPSIQKNDQIITIDIDDPAIGSVARWPWNWATHRLLFDYLDRHNISHLFVIDMDFSTVPPLSVTTDEEAALKSLIKGRDNTRLKQIISLKNPDKFITQTALMQEKILFSVPVKLKEGDIKEERGAHPEETAKPLPPTSRQKAQSLETFKKRESLDPSEQSFPVSTALLPPIVQLQENSSGTGVNAITPDHDGVVRHYPMFVEYEHRLYPSIVLKAAMAMIGADRFSISKGYVSLFTKDRTVAIPINEKGEMIINWTGRYTDSFIHIPFNLLASYMLLQSLKDELRGVSFTQVSDPMVVHNMLAERASSLSLMKAEESGNKAAIIFIAFLMEHYFANTNYGIEEVMGAIGLDKNNKGFLRIAYEVFLNNLAVKGFINDGVLGTFEDLLKLSAIKPSPEETVELKDSYQQMSYYLKKHGSVDSVRPLYFEPSKSLSIGSKEYKINPLFLEGRSVFYGLTATGLTAQNPTPFMGKHPMLDLAPQAVNTIVTGSFIRDIPSHYIMTLLALYTAMVIYTAYKLNPLRGLALTALIGFAHSFVTWQLFTLKGLITSVSPALASLSLSYSAAVFIRYFEEYQERRRVRKIFSTMVSPEVLKIMESRRDAIALAGEIKDATIFSSDVSGFTTISEGVTAQELANILNIYLTAMSNIIMSYDGYVDKYEGDAIKAVFGAPLADEHHHWKACYSALLQQEELKIIQLMILLKYGVKITARMGINTGTVYAGNMGSVKRVQYTVMGEAVHIAEELEPANKLFNTWIALGEDTVKRAGDYIVAPYLGEVELSEGHSIKAYELKGWNKEHFLSYWEDREIPELILESFSKMSPERALASLSFYRALGQRVDSQLLRDIIAFFEGIREEALEHLKIEALLLYIQFREQVVVLQTELHKMGMTDIEVDNEDPLDAEASIIRWRKLLSRISEAVKNGELAESKREEMMLRIDGMEKVLESFRKRSQTGSEGGPESEILTDYLRKMLISQDQTLSSIRANQLSQRMSSIGISIRNRGAAMAMELRSRSREYHILTASLVE